MMCSSVIKSYPPFSCSAAEWKVNSLLQVGCDDLNSWVSRYYSVNTTQTLDASSSFQQLHCCLIWTWQLCTHEGNHSDHCLCGKKKGSKRRVVADWISNRQIVSFLISVLWKLWIFRTMEARVGVKYATSWQVNQTITMNQQLLFSGFRRIIWEGNSSITLSLTLMCEGSK